MENYIIKRIKKIAIVFLVAGILGTCSIAVSAMRQNKYIKWSEKDRNKLIECVNANTTNNRVNWKPVEIEFSGSGRTLESIKMYYQDYVKNKEQKQQRPWSEAEKRKLINSVNANTENNSVNWKAVETEFAGSRNLKSIKDYYQMVLNVKLSQAINIPLIENTTQQVQEENQFELDFQEDELNYWDTEMPIDDIDDFD